MDNPILGVICHRLGELASGSFYDPSRGLRRWSWEMFWLVGGTIIWLIAPWIFAAFRTHELLGDLAATPKRTRELSYLFGILWGFGGLTFGLTMRYFGLSLGKATVDLPEITP
jgi:L-rhamnose-H+ transport protein